MTIDLNNTSDQWLDNWKDMVQKGIYVADPAKVIPTSPTHTITSTSNGIFGGVINDGSAYSEPWIDPIVSIRSRLDKLELQNKFLRLKILGMEGKFTQEEIANIRKMLMSNDEASVTLADSIIENA
jgi:hypothetical protein